MHTPESPKPDIRINTSATETASETFQTMRQCLTCKKAWPLEFNFNFCGGCGRLIIWDNKE